MAYANRIVIYLKAPTRTMTNAPGQPALINARTFVDYKPKVQEVDFTANSKPKEIPAHNLVCFTISAATRSSVLYIWGFSVNWEGGCRLVPKFLLGDKGDLDASTSGVNYGNTNELPVQDLHCTFNGAGLLTCTDHRGVSIQMDLAKPGAGALCLTVTAKPGSSGHLVFPNDPASNLDLVQPASPPRGQGRKRQQPTKP